MNVFLSGSSSFTFLFLFHEFFKFLFFFDSFLEAFSGSLFDNLNPIKVLLIQVEHVVVSHGLEFAEQELVIGFRVEVETSNVGEDLFELFGKGLSEVRDGDGEFLFHDFLILFLFALAFHALPGELAFSKVNQHVDPTFQIIPSALFNADVGID